MGENFGKPCIGEAKKLQSVHMPYTFSVYLNIGKEIWQMAHDSSIFPLPQFSRVRCNIVSVTVVMCATG